VQTVREGGGGVMDEDAAMGCFFILLCAVVLGGMVWMMFAGPRIQLAQTQQEYETLSRAATAADAWVDVSLTQRIIDFNSRLAGLKRQNRLGWLGDIFTLDGYDAIPLVALPPSI
jgi:hypothetical protein